MTEEATQEQVPEPPKGTPVTRRAVTRMHNSSRILANRFAPSMNADMKFGRLVSFLEPAATPQVGERARIAARVVAEAGGPNAVDTMGPVAQQAVAQMVQAEQEKYDDEIVYLDLPSKLVVTQDDLPQQKTGDAGWENANSRGALAADLGIAFQWPKD